MRRKMFLLSLKGIRPPRLIIYDDTDKAENRVVVTSEVADYQKNTFQGFKPQTIHARETTVFIKIAPNGNNAIT